MFIFKNHDPDDNVAYIIDAMSNGIHKVSYRKDRYKHFSSSANPLSEYYFLEVTTRDEGIFVFSLNGDSYSYDVAIRTLGSEQKCKLNQESLQWCYTVIEEHLEVPLKEFAIEAKFSW